MPIHDWSKVNAGTFQDFHTAWIVELRRVLNGGLLPDGFYAQAEQVAGRTIPDVLTLQDAAAAGSATGSHAAPEGGVAVATAPPAVSVHESISEEALLATRTRRLVIRHSTGDRIVALLEIVSPGNKEKRSSLNLFVDKARGALDGGYHLLILDLLPHGPGDEAGVHGAIWRKLGGWYEAPSDKPLTLAAYVAGDPVDCYVEPTAVGLTLIDMPLFIDRGHYVNVPLESTYQTAYEGVPSRWKRVIEGD